MAKPLKLKLGVGNPLSKGAIAAKRDQLKATVERYLPILVEMVTSKDQPLNVLMLHQDSFAADYHDDELLLLGMMVKYAGMLGVEVRIVGENVGTLPPKSQLEFCRQAVERKAVE